MTVKELIAELEKFPAETEVIYRCFSEFLYLEPGQVCLVTKEHKEIIKHKGNYMRVYDWIPEESREYQTVVVFPGN